MFPIGWGNDAPKENGSGSADGGAMHQSPGEGRIALKRWLRVESFQIRNRNDPCSGVDCGKVDMKDVIRDNCIDQICATKDFCQVPDGGARDAGRRSLSMAEKRSNVSVAILMHAFGRSAMGTSLADLTRFGCFWAQATSFGQCRRPPRGCPGTSRPAEVQCHHE